MCLIPVGLLRADRVDLMTRTFAIILILLMLSAEGIAQKVGVVLSGGGAKGIAHVGVLKALEEHEIPIDY